MVDIAGIQAVSVLDMTIGEIAYVERRTGIAITELGEPGRAMAAPMGALAGVALYRSGRWATPEEAQAAAEDLTLAQAQSLVITEATQGE